jgi:hypothetical protein
MKSAAVGLVAGATSVLLVMGLLLAKQGNDLSNKLSVCESERDLAAARSAQ